MNAPDISHISEFFSDCIKVLIVDLKTREYQTIKAPEEDETGFKDIDAYWKWFVESEFLHHEDVDKIADFFTKAKTGNAIIYRRKLQGVYRTVIIELKEFCNACIVLVKDITELYNDELSFVSEKVGREDVCGLLNAKAFKQDISRELKGNIGVAYIDLNGLKWVNDNKGHRCGDELISKLAKLLQESFPAYSLYRVGGDEFIIIGFNVKVRVFLHSVITFHKRIWTDIETFAEGAIIDGVPEKFPIAAVGYSADVAEDLEAIMTDAENQMYEDKGIFYEKYTRYKR